MRPAPSGHGARPPLARAPPRHPPRDRRVPAGAAVHVPAHGHPALLRRAWELYGQTAYTLRGLLDGEWGQPTWNPLPSLDGAALLAAWDGQTHRIQTGLPGVPPERYGETLTPAWSEMLTFTAMIGSTDNEIHHRAQGMVYLRELGVEPPAFWEWT